MGRRFDCLDDVQAFVAVAEQGSCTAAAVLLATTASVLSRAVTCLEKRLGNQLLRRTTRRVGLTDTGRRCLEQGARRVRAAGRGAARRAGPGNWSVASGSAR